MRIIMNEADIKEAIKDKASGIIHDQEFAVELTPARGSQPMSAEVVIVEDAAIDPGATVGGKIEEHTGSDAKKVTKAAPKKAAAKKETKAKKEVPEVEEKEAVEKTEEVVEKEDTTIAVGSVATPPAGNVNSLFNKPEA